MSYAFHGNYIHGMKLEDEIQQNRPFASAGHRALVNLYFTANWARSQQQVAFGHHGLSAQQFNILRILKGALPNSLPVSEVRARMIDRAPNTTRLLDKLVSKSLVERVRGEEDRRAVLVRITPAGLEVLDAIANRLPAHTQFLKNLTSAEVVELDRLLDKLRG